MAGCAANRYRSSNVFPAAGWTRWGRELREVRTKSAAAPREQRSSARHGATRHWPLPTSVRRCRYARLLLACRAAAVNVAISRRRLRHVDAYATSKRAPAYCLIALHSFSADRLPRIARSVRAGAFRTQRRKRRRSPCGWDRKRGLTVRCSHAHRPTLQYAIRWDAANCMQQRRRRRQQPQPGDCAASAEWCPCRSSARCLPRRITGSAVPRRAFRPASFRRHQSADRPLPG
ncbi:hypothetical protein OKW30_006186 [Paraburkholderia sp. Clong3]